MLADRMDDLGDSETTAQRGDFCPGEAARLLEVKGTPGWQYSPSYGNLKAWTVTANFGLLL